MINRPKFKTKLVLSSGKSFRLSNTEDDLITQCSKNVITVECIEASCVNDHDTQGICPDCVQKERRINLITNNIECFFSLDIDKRFTE